MNKQIKKSKERVELEQAVAELRELRKPNLPKFLVDAVIEHIRLKDREKTKKLN